MVKKGPAGVDYGVMPLEGLWWADDMSVFSTGKNKETWKWTQMIMQPEIVKPQMVAEATAQVQRKKKPAALPLVRFESFSEGKAAQILHVGPFSAGGGDHRKSPCSHRKRRQPKDRQAP